MKIDMRLAVMSLLAGAIVAAVPVLGQQTSRTTGYTGSATCKTCHAAQAQVWARSDHGLAWTMPTPEHIRADFDGTSFEHDGMTARFSIAPDDSRHISVTEANGETTDYKVHSVAGIEPLQQYLLETEPGRLQSFDIAWDTERKRWYHLYPDQRLPPDDGLHWTGSYKTWNSRCAECHATGFRKNYDPETRRYASTQVEIGVGCESCHGPGAEHVAWAREAPSSGAQPPANHGFAVDFSNVESTIQQCAGCHSRREPYLDGNPPPGKPYHDSYNLSLLAPGLYHADGQIQDEVYVYGSFLQSKMYRAGVSCMNCHDPHNAEIKFTGNTLCAQCHNPAGNPAFPSLKPANYDSPSHHFHESGTPGAQCVNCHMVERVYMGVDGRRDHSFRIPRPDLAAQTGAPDACTGCHTGQGADWAAARIAEWYPNNGNRRRHFGVTLALGRDDPAAAADALADLALDASEPGIARATALRLLEGSGRPAVAERAEPLLRDPDPLVRAAAIGVQRLAPPQNRIPRVVALLEDPVRNVRMVAAQAMLDAPVARLPEAMAADLRGAMAEWRASLSSRLDFPETHLQLGGLALTLRNMPAATTAFRETVLMDPQRIDAWVMLARISAATQGAEATRAVLEEAIAVNPGNEMLSGLMAEVSRSP